ncbi:MAG: GH25 family lysozyme [Bacteroidota bacterium]
MKPLIVFLCHLLCCLVLTSCQLGVEQVAEENLETIADSLLAEVEERPNQTTPSPQAAPDKSPAPAAPAATFCKGLDISHFQGKEISDLSKEEDGFTFIFCKATEGLGYIDPNFYFNWANIPQKGFIRGAYHFYHTADNPIRQAEHFTSVIASMKETDLPPVVDFEGGGIDKSQSVESIQEDLLSFLQEVEKRMNRRPMIYTDIPSGNKYLDRPEFGQYPLWVALYITGPQPRLPKAWQGNPWLFWQRSSHYIVHGQNNDFDLYNGNLNSLQNFIKESNL